MEDIKWIETLVQLRQKLRVPIWLRWTIIAILFVAVILCIIGVIQYNRDHQILDVKYTEERPDAFTYYGYTRDPEDLVKDSDVIYEGIVIDISFEAEKPDWRQNYYLNTIYTVAVIRTYKGSTNLIETIRVSNGLRDYKVQEQLDALQKVGAPESFRKINIHDGGIKPQIGSTYLFCVKERDDLQERWADNYSQFALSGNLEIPWYDKYNPNVIKEYLPYVPHPLLVRTVIDGILLTVLFIIRAKLKRKQVKAEE